MEPDVCVKCLNMPTIGTSDANDLFFVTCEECGGLYALGKTRDAAIQCWNHCVKEIEQL